MLLSFERVMLEMIFIQKSRYFPVTVISVFLVLTLEAGGILGHTGLVAANPSALVDKGPLSLIILTGSLVSLALLCAGPWFSLLCLWIFLGNST